MLLVDCEPSYYIHCPTKRGRLLGKSWPITLYSVNANFCWCVGFGCCSCHCLCWLRSMPATNCHVGPGVSHQGAGTAILQYSLWAGSKCAIGSERESTVSPLDS